MILKNTRLINFAKLCKKWFVIDICKEWEKFPCTSYTQTLQMEIRFVISQLPNNLWIFSIDLDFYQKLQKWTKKNINPIIKKIQSARMKNQKTVAMFYSWPESWSRSLSRACPCGCGCSGRSAPASSCSGHNTLEPQLGTTCVSDSGFY